MTHLLSLCEQNRIYLHEAEVQPLSLKKISVVSFFFSPSFFSQIGKMSEGRNVAGSMLCTSS